MRLLLVVCLLSFSLVQAVAAPDGNPPGTGWTPDQNVLGYVEQSDKLTRILGLLKLAGMTDILKGSAAVTFLAPTDEAVARLPAEMSRDLQTPENRAQLKSILGCHIVEGTATFDSLYHAPADAARLHLESITGCELTVRRNRDHIEVADANGISAVVIHSDVKETNGLVQVVDAVLTPGPAKADDCAGASSQSALDICTDQAFRRSDTALNKLFKSVSQRLKEDEVKTKLLIEAQRAWVAFRDAECAFSASGSATGSVYPMIVAQCRQALTDRRNQDLRRYLSCQEGDLSCPVPAP